MCKDIGSQKSLFTFKDGYGDCQCQEQVDSIDQCDTSSEAIDLYKYLGEIIWKVPTENIIVWKIVQIDFHCTYFH